MRLSSREKIKRCLTYALAEEDAVALTQHIVDLIDEKVKEEVEYRIELHERGYHDREDY